MASKKLLAKEEKEISNKDLKKELIKTKREFYILFMLFLILAGVSFYNSYKDSKVYYNDKLIVLREGFAKNYYKQDDVEKVLKSELGKNYTGKIQTDFDNYVLSIVTKNISKLDDDKWGKYTSFLSKEQVKSLKKDMEKEVSKSEYKKIDESTYYIKFGMFKTDVSAKEFKDHIDEMKMYDNLIVDLRDNRGGGAEETRLILDNFVDKEKVLFEYKYHDKLEKVMSKINKKLEFKNILILTNNKSASSSEMFTLALKENLDNVKVIGTTTYGKGIGQQYIEFDDGTQLRYTSFYWNSPKGNNILDKGIKPDIEVEGEKEQLNKALEYINQGL